MTTGDGDDPRVRPARRTDLPAVREALVSSWRAGYEGVVDADALAGATADPAAFYPAERFERKLADERLRFLVAEPAGDDRPRGIATVNWGPDNTHEFVPAGDAQFRSVYVHADHWGRGLGRALFAGATGALPASVDRLWVECLAENERANGFYRRLGFEPVEGRSIELFGDPHPTHVLRFEVG